jgi:hypothetical protein
VTVVVTDDAEARATQTYILTVRPNQPPQITPPPDQSVAAGASYRYDVRATDPEGDAITLVLDDGPTGMTMDDQGRIRGSPRRPMSGLTRSRSRPATPTGRRTPPATR